MTKFACDEAFAIAALFAAAAEAADMPSSAMAPARKSETERILILVSFPCCLSSPQLIVDASGYRSAMGKSAYLRNLYFVRYADMRSTN